MEILIFTIAICLFIRFALNKYYKKKRKAKMADFNALCVRWEREDKEFERLIAAAPKGEPITREELKAIYNKVCGRTRHV